MMLMLIKLYPLQIIDLKIEVMTASCHADSAQIDGPQALATKQQKILMMMKLCQNMKRSTPAHSWKSRIFGNPWFDIRATGNCRCNG